MGEALSSEDKVAHMNRIVMDRKAMDVVVLDMRDSSSITDYFLICSGGSERQTRAIADAIDEGMSPLGLASPGLEGYRDGHWILMDYGDVIVHVFSVETREYYDLERLWANAPRLDLSGEIAGVVSHHGASIG
jgi:ribosome-associated protein